MSVTAGAAKPTAPYMVNSYMEWAVGEGVPIVEDFAVDLGTAEVSPWARLASRW